MGRGLVSLDLSWLRLCGRRADDMPKQLTPHFYFWGFRCTCASKSAYNVLRNTHQHIARHVSFHTNTIHPNFSRMHRLARRTRRPLCRKQVHLCCLYAYLLRLSRNCSMCCVNGDTHTRVYSIRERFFRVRINKLSHLSVGGWPPSTCLDLGFAVGEPTTCQHNLSPTFISGVRGFRV